MHFTKTRKTNQLVLRIFIKYNIVMCSWDVGQDVGNAAGQSVHESRAKMLFSALAKSLFTGLAKPLQSRG
jgi:hypothetical protein